MEDLQLERAARRLLDVPRPERSAAQAFVRLIGAARAPALDAIFEHARSLSRALASELPRDRPIPVTVLQALRRAHELSRTGPDTFGDDPRARTTAAAVLLDAVADVLAWLGGGLGEHDGAESPVGDDRLAQVVPLFGRLPSVVERGQLLPARRPPPEGATAPERQPSLPFIALPSPTRSEAARRVTLEATARGMPGLDVALRRLEGHVVAGRYRMLELARIGSQFAVYKGHDDGDDQWVAIKLPLVDYARPVTFGGRELRDARRAAHRAWQGLHSVQPPGALLPGPIALVGDRNPLLSDRGSLGDDEVFLVEEWLDDPNLDDLRQAIFSGSLAAARRTELILGAFRAVTSSLSVLAPRLFADVAPRNFLWTPGSPRARLVDAGSVVPEGTPVWERGASPSDPARIVTPVTMVYLPADELAFHARGEARWLVRRTMLCAVGKMLHELASNRHPVLGRDPDPDVPEIALLPEWGRRTLRELLRGEPPTPAPLP